jgi:hypothetical protein
MTFQQLEVKRLNKHQLLLAQRSVVEPVQNKDRQ